MLSRCTFLTLSSTVALAIGLFALACPELLLTSKGVALPNDAAAVWVRELGIVIVALGLVMFLVRRHADSPTLRAVLVGNAVVQLGLFPLELEAFHAGIITRLSGVVPNSVLHVVLAAGFSFFAFTAPRPAR
jgi:hypothetical protein